MDLFTVFPEKHELGRIYSIIKSSLVFFHLAINSNIVSEFS